LLFDNLEESRVAWSQRLRLNRRRVVVGGAVIAASILVARSAVAQPAADGQSLGWSDELDQGNGKLSVATTVAPISSIVRNVGGDRINLRGIVPDGTNSHTFEPAPSDAAILAAADLVIVNGLGLELPTIALAEANLKEGAEIVSLGEQTISEEEWVFDFSFPEANGQPNPHLWTNVAHAMTYAELVAATLSERDPANADYYAANLERYLALLTALDAGIMAAVATIPPENRKLLTYHDSWAYFAPRYGLTVIGAVQPSDFTEPSPREVAGLVTQIREEQVPAVFGSEVFPSGVLEQIAQEAGAVYVDQLRDDAPPGAPGDPEHTYVGMMLRNMELMIPALGGETSALAGIEPDDTFERTT
jgi:ABC-type Zn uptake system ZnuABC Zn-binding protein ZnuA